MEARLAPIAAFLIILTAPLFAGASAGELANYAAALDARIGIPNATLTQSPQSMPVHISVQNPTSEPFLIYLLHQEDGGWAMVDVIGAIPPGERLSAQLDIEVQHGKDTVKKDRYVIAGKAADGTAYGTSFEISEDWGAYELALLEGIAQSAIIVVPVAALALILLMLAVARLAWQSKSPEQYSGEYSLKSLMLPTISGRPLAEKVADVLINPAAMALQLACVAILVFVMFDTISVASGMAVALQVMLLSATGSSLIPFLYFAAAWYFEKREEGKPLRFFMGMFVWGMFAAFLSFILTSAIVSDMKAYEVAPYALIATMLVAPVVEEALKGLGVLAMSGHHEYNDALTGILLGFSCGLGFAFVENWFYFAFKTSPLDIGLAGWAALIAYRSFFNSLAHGCFTAATALGIGYAKGNPRLKKYAALAFIPGLFLAIAIHFIYNLSALADVFVIANKQVSFFLFNPMLTLLMGSLFFLVLVLAVIDEKKRKAEGQPVPQQPQGGADIAPPPAE